jgi:two-component system sensor histidine kinase CpxA
MSASPEMQAGKPRLRLSLYAKILLWFLVNLVVVAALVGFYVRVTFKTGLDWLLSGPPGARIELVASYLQSQLVIRPQSEWPSVVEGFGDYILHPREGWEPVLRSMRVDDSVSFALFGSDGQQVLGHALEVPHEVRRRLMDKRVAERRPRQARRDDSDELRMQPPKPRFMLQSQNPTRYWTCIHSDITFERDGAWHPLTLVIVSTELTAGGLLFDWQPWVMILLMCVSISAILWLPVVGGITRSIRRTNEASKRIAAGQFDVRLPDQRGDELGELATSVNAMAEQLGHYMTQQRRITADVAHELCSPIARMQMALGVVEQRSTPEQASYLQKLDRELQHMAGLVEQVLLFAKAETWREHEPSGIVELRDLVEQVLAREAPEIKVMTNVPELKLVTVRSALDRAVGNVVRNAVLYASDIEIHAEASQSGVSIRILDRGPGVPTEALERLFLPFYRPEAARGRSTGGSGLGLAIVKRCIDACGGTVTAANRAGGGLEVVMQIPALVH